MIHVKPQRVKGWSTHNYVLLQCLLASKGPVLEVGSGLYSTPLLHWMCRLQGRKLLTYENEQEFYDMARVFKSRMHRVEHIEDWDTMDFNTHWGVVLIDHHPEKRRAVDIVNFKDSADYIVIHDTDREDKYDFAKAWPHFKYRYTWQGCKPWTTVVSNTKDLSNIKD